jgi:hypothetical protein
MDIDDTSTCLVQSHGDIITNLAAHCAAAVTQKFYSTLNYPSTLDSNQQRPCDGSGHRYLSAAPFTSEVVKSSSRVHHACSLQSVACLHTDPLDIPPVPVCVTVGMLDTQHQAIHLVICETGRNYEQNSNYSATNISSHQEPCQCAIIPYCHECCVGKT